MLTYTNMLQDFRMYALFSFLTFELEGISITGREVAMFVPACHLEAAI
jgi:hypothetical protein